MMNVSLFLGITHNFEPKLFILFLAVVATKAVRKRGPGPSKPPPVTLGVSGKGFGEKVPSSAKAVKNGIKTIGVLAVDKDFGNFIEVDKSYWNKEVAPFVGERVSRLNFISLVISTSPCLVYRGLRSLPALRNAVPQILD